MSTTQPKIECVAVARSTITEQSRLHEGHRFAKYRVVVNGGVYIPMDRLHPLAPPPKDGLTRCAAFPHHAPCVSLVTSKRPGAPTP